MATFTFAVGVVDEKPGLPKALTPIRPYFAYLVKKQCSYGYTVFLNINITRRSMDDVRQLTEIAHDHGIATDYHINESPLLQQDEHFRHADQNVTYITEDDWPAEYADNEDVDPGEELWTEVGDPVNDFVAVTERSVEWEEVQE